MTEKEPMSFARNDIMRAAEAALKAYDQGVEDGIRQERERIREALLSEETVRTAGMAVAMSYPDWDEEGAVLTAFGVTGIEIDDARVALEAALDHIGLGAVTTEASEK